MVSENAPRGNEEKEANETPQAKQENLSMKLWGRCPHRTLPWEEKQCPFWKDWFKC